MIQDLEFLYNQLNRFINGSPSGLLQILTASARQTTFDRIISCPTYPVPAKTSGLSLAISQFREAMAHPDIHPPTFLARLYISTRKLEHRKRTGQFFTSQEVAHWGISTAPPRLLDHVCDAGAGTGVFAYAILRAGVSVRSYTGVENDPILALCIAHVLESIKAPGSYKAWYSNFLLLRESSLMKQGLKPPTLVISNPPFIRYHNLAGRARIRMELKSSLGILLSSLSGSGSYFLLRAAELASSHKHPHASANPIPRLLFYLPNEAAGAAHARRLRDELERFHGWTWDKYKIPNSHAGVDRHPSNSLALFFVFEKMKLRNQPPQRQSKTSTRLQDLMKIRRGISTGCNQYFVLMDEDARIRQIPSRYLLEVLPTRIPIRGSSFSKQDWELLRKSGRPCWLLALPNTSVENLDKHVQMYLKEGIRRGVHMTPTAKALRNWFSIPVPAEPPDVFVTYLFRGAPRFVLNSAGVRHLTNILGGRFVSDKFHVRNQESIIEVLNIQAIRWKNAGRVYKGGLRKIEPRELSMLPIDPAIIKSPTSEREAKTVSLFD